MKTLEETVEWLQKRELRERCIDGRDAGRLASFLPVGEWEKLGMKLREGADAGEPLPWTEEQLRVQLEHDLAFGFEKALGKRGISAGLMAQCVRMWLFALDHPLFAESADDKMYAQYGLPLFKATALAFGWPNPIGDDRGDEFKYSAESEPGPFGLRFDQEENNGNES